MTAGCKISRGGFGLANRIWIDVEDLFVYRSFGVRLSGIQRLEFELCRALAALPQGKGRVFFVRHDVERECLTTVPWEAVEAIFRGMRGEGKAGPQRCAKKPSSERPGAERRAGIRTATRSFLRKAFHALPPSLSDIFVAQLAVFVAIAKLVQRQTVRIAAALKPRWRFQNSGVAISSASAPAVARGTAHHFMATAGQGDILAALGSPWIRPNYSSYIERAVREKGLRFALLIYDIIPVRRPEMIEEGHVENFRTWLHRSLPLADTLLTISIATARDVAAYARNAGLALRALPTPIPIGTGFKTSDAGGQSSADEVSSRLPAPDSYALVVSTIEARKNHVLLFRVWRRLLEDMPAESVPTLVFAGRIGWLVSDFMQQLHNTNFLDGKIIHIDSPTDQELEALYDGCLFTLLPSFYEGWGLPVTESFAFGRPCIISEATSLPEAGGSLARYIDPDNATDAYRVIRETIEDQAGLRAWRDRVRREFRPVEWSESGRAVLRLLDASQDAPAPAEMKLRRSA
jgi:glycosyltransferase involved in cell wall biosynthesis